MSDKIEGRNPVMEAIRAHRTIDKLYVKKGDATLGRIIQAAKDAGIPVTQVDARRLDEISQTGAHQGIIARSAVHTYATVEDILNMAKEKNEQPFIILCDKLTDPHNLGSVLRTANAVGAHGVVIPKHDSVGLNATVAKTSAGAVEYTPVAKVTNLAATIRTLKEEGLWVVGADAEGETDIYGRDMTGPIALVVGSEGNGISRLVRESCDFLVSIPMHGQINSLNASVAAAVIMYEVLRQRAQNKA